MIRQDFPAMINDLKKSSLINVIEYSAGLSGISYDTALTLIEGVSEITELKIPENYVEFFLLGEGFNIFWRSKDDITGEFYLTDIGDGTVADR